MQGHLALLTERGLSHGIRGLGLLASDAAAVAAEADVEGVELLHVAEKVPIKRNT